MTLKNKKTALLLVANTFMLSYACAQSTDLGVTQEQMHTCLEANRPAQGSTPQAGDMETRQAALLSCLQKYNSSVTKDSLDSFMKSHRPPGRPMGGPNGSPPPQQPPSKK